MGSLYLLFAIHAGVDGTLFSMRVRIELALPFVSPISKQLGVSISIAPASPEFCPSGGRRGCWVDRLPAAQQ